MSNNYIIRLQTDNKRLTERIIQIERNIQQFRTFLRSDKFLGTEIVADKDAADYAALLRLRAHDMIQRNEYGSALLYKVADELEKRNTRQERKDWIATADLDRFLTTLLMED